MIDSRWNAAVIPNLQAAARRTQPPVPGIPVGHYKPIGIWAAGKKSARCHRIAAAGIAWEPDGKARLGMYGHCGAFLSNVLIFTDIPDYYDFCEDCLLAGPDVHVVYRFYDMNGGLLYLGYSAQFHARLRSHQTTSPWWSEVHSSRLAIYDNAPQALAMEAEGIREEQPQHNRQYKPRHVATTAA